ncbi:hypothetical protein BU24DRAFT_139154 [Aaosphaeria arxii CBS 175.79]|uniref:Secreted protein n=1 Tax=Aaosphaeria arxii CBS 175.79 TaxID=1450172 RepID=A0A6A5XV61_9PLEO|nr:uncharacterized protein BU24DRAFT_139154 [Aaosphaeria arxii CBS 175.79]KAF2016839.1 hypothetical protein BU24DRAFT_139154 [Aaosphaeria arxii CBS 175.79]
MICAITIIYLFLSAVAIIAAPNPRPHRQDDPTTLLSSLKPTTVPGTTWAGPGTGVPSVTGTTVALPSASPSISATETTVASPSASPSPVLGEKAGVFACEHVVWGGKCQLFNNPIGGAPEQCTVIPEDFKISSVGPDKGWKCLFYKSAICRDVASPPSGILTLTWPGNDRLTEANDANGVTWNDNIRSYQCFKETAE